MSDEYDNDLLFFLSEGQIQHGHGWSASKDAKRYGFGPFWQNPESVLFLNA